MTNKEELKQMLEAGIIDQAYYDAYANDVTSEEAVSDPPVGPSPITLASPDMEERYKEARDLYSSRRYKKAIALLTALAEGGYAPAQYFLGTCYISGIGVEQDQAQAVEWTVKAAQQGNDSAQCNLGDFYLNGSGVAQNFIQAAEWYYKSAEQGEALARYKLNDCYTDSKNAGDPGHIYIQELLEKLGNRQ